MHLEINQHILFIMVKSIDIEYCGGWGYGGPANRLKKSI